MFNIYVLSSLSFILYYNKTLIQYKGVLRWAFVIKMFNTFFFLFLVLHLAFIL